VYKYWYFIVATSYVMQMFRKEMQKKRKKYFINTLILIPRQCILLHVYTFKKQIIYNCPVMNNFTLKHATFLGPGFLKCLACCGKGQLNDIITGLSLQVKCDEQ